MNLTTPRSSTLAGLLNYSTFWVIWSGHLKKRRLYKLPLSSASKNSCTVTMLTFLFINVSQKVKSFSLILLNGRNTFLIAYKISRSLRCQEKLRYLTSTLQLIGHRIDNFSFTSSILTIMIILRSTSFSSDQSTMMIPSSKTSQSALNLLESNSVNLLPLHSNRKTMTPLSFRFSLDGLLNLTILLIHWTTLLSNLTNKWCLQVSFSKVPDFKNIWTKNLALLNKKKLGLNLPNWISQASNLNSAQMWKWGLKAKTGKILWSWLIPVRLKSSKLA